MAATPKLTQVLLERAQRCMDDASAALSGALAYRRFCTPALSGYRTADHDLLIERSRFYLRDAHPVSVATQGGNLQAYVFEPGSGWTASVLMVHGWTGEASFMSALAEHFRRRGFRVVLFDFPAHGKSPGRHTNLIACAHATREIAEALGPVHFVVAHSLGGHAALLAGGGGPPMPRVYPFRAFVLLSMPNEFAAVTRAFGERLRLRPAALRNFERRLEQLAQRSIAEFTGANLLAATGRPALLVHARDDTEIPFAHAEQIAAQGLPAELVGFEGLGHRKILYAPPVARCASTFLLRHRQLLCAPQSSAQSRNSP